MKDQKSIAQWEQLLIEKLSSQNLDEREAWDILSLATNKSKAQLISQKESQLSPATGKKLLELFDQRKRLIPFAYLSGTKGFYGLDFFVTPNVLIPRPETEMLIDWVLKHVVRNKSVSIADIGTGSGCIAVTLAKFLPLAKIIATDISEHALAIAKRNAKLHGVTKRIQFYRGDLFEAFPKKTEVEIIAANLPYLTKEELGNVPHEPIEALYGGKLGLNFIEQLIGQITHRKIERAILEISPPQEKWLEARFLEDKTYHADFLKDLSNNTRFLTLVKA